MMTTFHEIIGRNVSMKKRHPGLAIMVAAQHASPEGPPWVDGSPACPRPGGWLRLRSLKSFRMDLEGRWPGVRPRFKELRCVAVLDHLGGAPADPRVAVRGVIPAQERRQSPSMRDVSQPFWDIGPVSAGLERRCGRWLVVVHLWPAVGLGQPHVRAQQGHRVRGHPAATVGMNCSVAWLHPLLVAGLLDQRRCQARTLPIGPQPAHPRATVEVEDDRAVVIAPVDRLR